MVRWRNTSLPRCLQSSLTIKWGSASKIDTNLKKLMFYVPQMLVNECAVVQAACVLLVLSGDLLLLLIYNYLAPFVANWRHGDINSTCVLEIPKSQDRHMISPYQLRAAVTCRCPPCVERDSCFFLFWCLGKFLFSPSNLHLISYVFFLILFFIIIIYLKNLEPSEYDGYLSLNFKFYITVLAKKNFWANGFLLNIVNITFIVSSYLWISLRIEKIISCSWIISSLLFVF